MTAYMVFGLSGHSTLFYLKVPVIESYAFLGLSLTSTDSGFPFVAPVTGSILVFREAIVHGTRYFIRNLAHGLVSKTSLFLARY